ncbi:oligosaccharide repeat unit polymerase [Lachnospiraceae bacterium PFB1-21]
MRQRSNVILEYGIYMLAYLVSYILSLAECEIASGTALIFAAIYLYRKWYKETGNIVDLRGVFTLAWVGGQGVACLQLSRLQTSWHYLTWLCFFVIYLGFGVGYEWGLRDGRVDRRVEKAEEATKRIFQCINVLGLVSLTCFVIEVVIRGYIPLISQAAHSAFLFPVSGLHYLTLGGALIPALSVLYIQSKKDEAKRKMGIIIFWNVVSVLVLVMCIARSQILLAVGIALTVYIATNKRIKGRIVVLLLLVLIPLYVLLTIAKDHNVAYLNSVFEMKNRDMPIFITQPYMYVANNFENFNMLVENIGRHTFGLKMLFPFFALTGLKYVIPKIVDMPMYLTKPELTTLTMFYDAYYDFGVVGVCALAILVGVIAKIIVRKVRDTNNPIIFLFYGQFAVYLGLAFFTTWLSSPVVWMWFILSAIVFWYVGKGVEKDGV